VHLDVGIAHGFLDVYRAFCSYHGIESSQELAHHIHRIVESGSYDLDLTTCPGIEIKSDISLNLVPIFSALRFNTYFRGLFVQDVDKRSELTSLIADVLRLPLNKFVTEII
jgi:hypothetical protein